MKHNPDRHSGDHTARDRARRLRAAQSLPEAKLWQQLRGDRLAGLKFRRQHPIGRFTADFYCPSARLVLELDGRTHDRVDDPLRDAEMKRLGLTVIRFTVSDFERNPEGVLDAILRVARALIDEREREEKEK